jgi:hypothetical protein
VQGKEATMSTQASSPDTAMPEFDYGSVWVVGADRDQLSPVGRHALATADAVIYDPQILQSVLDLVQPPHYREAAVMEQAIRRAIKLARDGWRVALLVNGDPTAFAVATAARFDERGVPFFVAPADARLGNASIGLLLVRRSSSAGGGDAGALVVVIAPPIATTGAGQRQRPLDFSMSGLAG